MKWKYETKPSPIGTMHGIWDKDGNLICWLSAASVQFAPVIEAALDNAERVAKLDAQKAKESEDMTIFTGAWQS